MLMNSAISSVSNTVISSVSNTVTISVKYDGQNAWLMNNKSPVIWQHLLYDKIHFNIIGPQGPIL